MSNLLIAIKRIIDNPIIEIKEFYSGKNRANSVGAALELYIRDLFADTFDSEEPDRMTKTSEVFSYIGTQNNPPDLMIRQGDAIEIKKVESPNVPLNLNSSYPKAKLFSDNPLITRPCVQCEEWSVKDMIYVVGYTSDTNINYLWFIYGDCFCADREFYELIKGTIKQGITNIPNVELADTKELGSVKRVDPLQITNLRIRGMWTIENPHKIFSYLLLADSEANFQLFCLMRKQKFDTFNDAEKDYLLNLKKENYTFRELQILNPSNPAEMIDSIMINYKIK